MKNILITKYLGLLIAIGILCTLNTETYAQCINIDPYGSATANNSANSAVTISTCNYQTEYSTVSGIVAGNTNQLTYDLGGCVTISSAPNDQLQHRIVTIEERLSAGQVHLLDSSMVEGMVTVRNRACKKLLIRGNYPDIQKDLGFESDQVTVTEHPFPPCRVRFVSRSDLNRMSLEKQDHLGSQPQVYRIF